MSDLKAIGLIIIAFTIVAVAWHGANLITQYLAALS